MNKVIIVSMGLPILIRNALNQRATIEMNQDQFIVCRFHPHNTVYLIDAKLDAWYPVNWYNRCIYWIKIILGW